MPKDTLNMLVSDVLLAAPATAQVFVSRGMSCPGCPFARFETVAEVAAIYRQDANELAASLCHADAASPPPQEDSSNDHH